MLTFEEFTDRIAAALEIPLVDLRQLGFDELGFDSLRLLELDLVVEELGAFLPEAAFSDLTRIADVYREYCSVLSNLGTEST